MPKIYPKAYSTPSPTTTLHQTSIFTRVTYTLSQRGEGVQIILDSSERLSGIRPTYQLVDESELLLVIPAASIEVEG